MYQVAKATLHYYFEEREVVLAFLVATVPDGSAQAVTDELVGFALEGVAA